jgi:hypothetical protein
MFGKLITVEREREREREQGEPLREVAKEMPVVRFVRILNTNLFILLIYSTVVGKEKRTRQGKQGKQAKEIGRVHIRLPGIS